jgi:hypothetical protein
MRGKAGVAIWPNVRPHNSKGAEQNSERPDQILGRIGATFSLKGAKGAEF